LIFFLAFVSFVYLYYSATMASVTWQDPTNGDLVKTIFGAENLMTMTMLDGKKLPVVSWQGAVNAYNLLYEDHVWLIEEAKHTLAPTNAEGRAIEDIFAEREVNLELWNGFENQFRVTLGLVSKPY
jgi:hypothetical protein